MAALIPNFTPPAPGLPGPIAGGEPLLAVDPDRMTSMLNGYLGFLALEQICRVHLVGEVAYDGTEHDYQLLEFPYDDPPAYIPPPPIRLRPSAGARHIYLLGYHIAHPGLFKVGGVDTVCSLTVTLKALDGEVLDGPIAWTPGNGYLALTGTALADVHDEAILARQPEPPAGNGLPFYDPTDPDLHDAWRTWYEQNRQTPEQIFETGWGYEVILEDPRLIKLPADCPPEVELVFDAAGVRVYSVCVLEAYEGRLA